MTGETTNYSKSKKKMASIPESEISGLSFANHIDALLAYWDNQQICRFANNAYVKWFGKSREDLVDTLSMEELLGSDYNNDRPYVAAALQGKTQQFEQKILIANGEIRYSVINYYPYVIDGIVKGFFSYVSDISRQKEVEEKLSQFAAIVEFSADAIVSKKLDGTILTWNRGAEKILGFKHQEIIGKAISIIIPPELLNEERDLILRLLNGENIEKYETIRIRKDKTRINVSITLSTVKDKQGTLVAISKVLRDNTTIKKVERELTESNERSKIFISQCPNAIAMFDMQMRYMAVSGRWLKDYNLIAENVIGRSHYEIFPEIDEDWKLIHQRCLLGAIDTNEGSMFVRADGSVQWLSWDVRPWYVTEGIVGGLLMYTADITSIKQKDAEKERTEQILEISNNMARIGTWEVTDNPKHTSWSKMAHTIFEVPVDYQPDNSTVRDFYKRGEHFNALMAAVERSIENGTPYDLEAQITAGNGITKWLRIIGNAEFKNGRCVRRFGVFQDITRAKNIEDELNQANEKLGVLLDSVYVSIIACDLNGLITNFNKGAEILLQYKASEMVGIHTPAIFHVESEVSKRGAELSELTGRPIRGFDVFTEVARHVKFDSREWTYVRKNGTTFPVQLVITSVRNAKDEIVGYMGVATDITERKESEEKNRKYAILESKSKEMEQFAYIASHDLREPLLTIRNYLDLLEDDFGAGLEEGAKHYTQSIANAANRMDVLIKGLLDYSRLSKVQHLQVVDCKQLLAEVEADLNSLILSSDANIISGKMPFLKAYPLELKLLFQNLITNAIKFHRKGINPVVEISAGQIDKGWQFQVRDNGIGIAERDKEKIFLMFQRLHSRTKYEGTGIGLTHCKKIAELHNGTIWVESIPGEFASFHFTILT